MTTRQTEAPIPLTSRDLLATDRGREFVLIGGKDGVGKTSALISIAMVVAGLVDDLTDCVIFNPAATVYVLDTEHKFASIYRQFGSQAPQNIVYYYCAGMDELLAAFDAVLAAIKPGDWIFVDSMARVWEGSQDLGYREIAGLSKAAFLAKRRESGKGGPIPQPDNFWSIVKSAHDRHFLNVLIARDDINVAMTTILVRPPREAPNRRENADRKELRAEFGIDAGLGGAPTLPYQPETLILLDRSRRSVSAIVLRDNNSTLDDPSIEFEVATKKDFGIAWMRNCRAAQVEGDGDDEPAT